MPSVSPVSLANEARIVRTAPNKSANTGIRMKVLPSPTLPCIKTFPSGIAG